MSVIVNTSIFYDFHGKSILVPKKTDLISSKKVMDRRILFINETLRPIEEFSHLIAPLCGLGFDVQTVAKGEDAQPEQLSVADMVVIACEEEDVTIALVQVARAHRLSSFIAVWTERAGEDPFLR